MLLLLPIHPSGLYLDEIQQKLRDVREVSIASLARALAALELTRKQVSKAASERHEELRTLWEMMMADAGSGAASKRHGQ
jgi:hypothetical protein